MGTPIEFCFDFLSRYGCIAAQKVEALVAEAGVDRFDQFDRWVATRGF